MPGISGAARLVKSAATSKTTKTAVKKAAKSDVVKGAVSTIVLDAAVPKLKERVEHRLDLGEDSQAAEEDQTFNSEDLGEWNDPTTLGLNSELYARYLRNQILVLSEYEIHLEEYELPDYEDHVESFYAQCEQPMLQLRATKLVAESMESYQGYLENYAVRNDDFREYILDGPEKPKIELEVLSANGDTREGLERMEEYLERCHDYVDYLLKYTDEDSEFASYVSSYGNLIKGDVPDLENAVIAALRYLNYLEQYAENDEEFQKHIARFSPEGEAYYSLMETENQLLKRGQNNST